MFPFNPYQYNPHHFDHSAVFGSQASYEEQRRLCGLDNSSGGAPSAAPFAPTTFPNVVDSIARPLYANPSVVVEPPFIQQPMFANTGGYINARFGDGYGGYGLLSSSFDFTEPLQEERGVFSVVRDVLFGSPERENASLSGQNTWGWASNMNPPAFDSWGHGNGYYQEPTFASVRPAPVETQTGADSGDVFHDWNSIQRTFLKHSESDVHVDNAVENLSILYVHSAAFRDMVASLVNHLKAAKATISIQSGTKVKHGQFHRKNATIELNTAAVSEAGRQLATLALHLTNASYLTNKSNKGESSKAFEKECLALMETYYQQAGTVLEEMGLGKQNFWVKSKPSAVAQPEAELETPVEEQAQEAPSAEVEVPSAVTSRQVPSRSKGKKSWNNLWRASVKTLKNLSS